MKDNWIVIARSALATKQSRFGLLRHSLRSFLAMTIIALLFFAAAQALCAQESAQTLFTKANSFYKEGLYGQAITAYQEIIRQGQESGDIYYNLGNCYFKKQELGRAILNYERAKIFLPNDSDLKANYQYALSQLNFNQQPMQKSFLGRGLDNLSAGLGLNLMAGMLSLLFFFIFLAVILQMLIAPRKPVLKALIVFLAILFIIGVLSFERKIRHLKLAAMVVGQEAEARFEPASSATVYFSLAQGAQVQVLESLADWSKIRRSDKKIGWVKNDSIEMVLP